MITRMFCQFCDREVERDSAAEGGPCVCGEYHFSVHRFGTQEGKEEILRSWGALSKSYSDMNESLVKQDAEIARLRSALAAAEAETGYLKLAIRTLNTLKERHVSDCPFTYIDGGCNCGLSSRRASARLVLDEAAGIGEKP